MSSPGSTRRQIGSRLADAIQHSPCTIAQVATRLRVREGTVLRWRAGENFPDLEHLLELSGLLNVNLHWLLTGAGRVGRPRR